jgi:hypothetical protein
MPKAVRDGSPKQRGVAAEQLMSYARLSGFISIAGLIIIFAAILYSAYWIANLSHEIAGLEDRRTALSAEITNLNDQISDLTQVRDKLSGSVTTLSSALAQNSSITPDTRKTIQTAENARYSVHVWGYKANPQQFSAVVDYLKGEGFTVTFASELESRPKWLPEKSMVNYYSPDSLAKARDVADQLTNLTSTKFTVAVGGGYGVSKGSERWDLRVHFIGD